jgi:terminase, large subunit
MQAARQLPITEQIIPLLTCLPTEQRSRLSGRSLTSDRVPVLHLPGHVRRFIRTPERITPSEFATKHRTVTDGAHPGPWRREHAPHTAAILDAFGQPWVREIWYCGVDQSGKTITMTNCLAWATEHLSGDMFYLMPSEETAKNIVDQKLRPMFEQSPHLKAYLSDRKDDTAITRIRLRNGKVIRPSWAGSPVAMATWAAQVCFGDEVDKFPEQAGKEADPITLIKKRARTFSGRSKMFFASTPAGRFIRQGAEACHQVNAYRVRCPHCQELIAMDGEHLVLAEGATVETVERDGCGYACNACSTIWDEADRMRAIRGGAWVAIKGGELARPAKVGFVHRAWECLDVTLREIGVAWLKKQHGTLTDKIAWANGVEADNYQHEQVDRQEAHILRLVDPSLPRGVVPAEVAALLLLVDTQRYGFRYQVWAIGYGQQPRITVIDRGFVHKFADLDDLAAREWQDATGRSYRVHAGWIDSGGGTDPHHPKHSRTQAVYLYCKRNPLFHPLKGRREQAQPWNITRIDYLPSRNGKKVALPGGLNLYTLNVTLYKGELAQALEVEMGDPGSMRLHAGISTSYAAQMCAEYQDERGYWICPRHKENHDWDISTYGFAAIDIMGIRNWRPDTDTAARRRGVRSRGLTD